MKKTCIWVAALLMACSACGEKGSVKKPDVLLSEQQMIDVLADTYLIEGELNHRRTVGQDVSKLQNAYYRQLFEHYNITDTLFKQNLKYYSYHPEVLETIMDSVCSRLDKAQ